MAAQFGVGENINEVIKRFHFHGHTGDGKSSKGYQQHYMLHSLIQREAEDELWQLARRTLPELQCQALWLKYAEEMSVEQIARVLRRTQVHVKVLLFRARTRLARELETQAARETPGGRSYTNSQFPRTLEKPGIRVTRPSKLDEVCKGC